MKVVLVGNSEWAGNFGAAHERVSHVLEELLRAEYPDEEVEVTAWSWNYLSDARIASLLAAIEAISPDYLVLVPALHWVTLPMVSSTVQQRSPDFLLGLVHRLVLFDHVLTRRFEHSRRGLLNLYKMPVGFIGSKLFGAEPRFTPEQAIAIVERFIRAGQRNESTEILLVGWLSLAEFQAYCARKDAGTFAKNYPLRNMPRLVKLIAAIGEICARRHVTFIHHERIPVLDLMGDKFHTGEETKQHRATSIAAAIAASERVYSGTRTT